MYEREGATMGERGSRKIPVTERQFLWVQDDDKGEVVLHVGPTMVSPTAADRVVISDGRGGFREDRSGQPQMMVALSDAQYAVLINPISDLKADDGPNGNVRPGRNESGPLKNGTRHMIPGPCSFYLRPGQRVEVRDAHELASNQYLVVKVYGEVDKTALYYPITAMSASITTANADPIRTLGTLDDPGLTRGQLIVIRGLDTQFYTPPTGVDIVPDLSIDDAGNRLTAAAARRLLAAQKSEAPAESPPSYDSPIDDDEYSQELLDEASLMASESEESVSPIIAKEKQAKQADRFGGVEQAARARHQVPTARAMAPQPPPPPAVAPAPLAEEELKALLSNDVHREALKREVRKSRLVREAVVLSEKEFCVVIDADGKRQIKMGPARVFPGPYDSFMTKGSDNRIYYAYELLPQRALWLRFISPITREKLAGRLPRGVELEKTEYFPGDELIVTGINTFFFPFIEVEILHPLSGQPHFGNDHSSIFIEAIGLDQKSGIYVRDLATGEVRLVRGKRSYLVDPRKEVHITRRVPADDWNLWVVPGEPEKSTRMDVTTPWALSLNVPHNTAILVASAEGHRVVEGPCVELLEYDERLVALSLSTGRPKTDERCLRTCFLRTAGNVVSDVLRIETSDFVKVDIQVAYRVTFDGEKQTRWFNNENYVGLICDHLRSLVRRQFRQLRLAEVWPKVPDVVRDLILGERTESGRKGRLFEENGMWVTEVEVLTSRILDEEIGTFLEKVQRESVSLQLSDRQATEQLRSEQLRHQIESERFTMRREAGERKANLEALVRKLGHEARLSEIQNGEEAAMDNVQRVAQREMAALQSTIEREHLESQAERTKLTADAEAQVSASRLTHAEEEAWRRVLTTLETEMIAARSKALVAEREAVQPALVEALAGLGDKAVLTEVAKNMNLISLFKGKDAASLFAEILGGTKVGRTIATMLPDNGDQTAVDE